MDENSYEEDAVKVRDRTSGTDDGTPEEAHRPIRDVVLMTKNVNEKMQRVINHYLRACESTSTIRLSKGGFYIENLRTSITIEERNVATRERSERR